MFNLKDKTPLLSIKEIVDTLTGVRTEDPDHTVWYIDNNSHLAMMIQPAYGMIFYNDQMQIEGLYDVYETSSVAMTLSDYGIDLDSKVWIEIGIDQIDYHYQ